MRPGSAGRCRSVAGRGDMVAFSRDHQRQRRGQFGVVLDDQDIADAVGQWRGMGGGVMCQAPRRHRCRRGKQRHLDGEDGTLAQAGPNGDAMTQEASEPSNDRKARPRPRLRSRAGLSSW